MKLEKRYCKLIKDTGKSKIYEVKCSHKVAMDLKPYIIEEKPLCIYDKSPYCSWDEWQIPSLKEGNVGTGMILKNQKSGKEQTIWDDHLVFIIPRRFEKHVKEGFYEAKKNPKACESLAYYVENITTHDWHVLQNMGGPGDEEYSWLKALCDIDEALFAIDDMTYDKTEKGQEVIESVLPLGVRRIIKIEVPYGKEDIVKGLN